MKDRIHVYRVNKDKMTVEKVILEKWTDTSQWCHIHESMTGVTAEVKKSDIFFTSVEAMGAMRYHTELKASDIQSAMERILSHT